MKTQTIVTGVTHDNLVNLFSTATYGSNWLVCRACAEVRKFKKDGDCHEDLLAKALINGLTIEVFDYYAEGEFYGTLPHTREEEDDDCVHYTVTLKDIEQGLARCFDNDDKYVRECAECLLYEGDDFDLTAAETLMQVIVFGEVIYG